MISLPASTDPGALQDRLGYEFTDDGLLQLALTHRSWCAENDGAPSNERLEFLGDAVLGLVVTHELFQRFPELPEGQLAKARASVVSAAALAEVGRAHDIGEMLVLGKGEDASGGRTKGSILADAVEAIIGAVYLDGGIESARSLVLGVLAGRIEVAARTPGRTDYKTRLQELAARAGLGPPRYVVDQSGPDHDKRFHAVVSVGTFSGVGDGSSKKQAEQHAAELAGTELSALEEGS